MSSVLLDTHIWIWLIQAPENLTPSVLKKFEDPRTKLYLSVASIWEIAIKTRLGKLKLPEPAGAYVPKQNRLLGIEDLPISSSHAFKSAELPTVHSDPFDRLLISTALVEGLPIATADPVFKKYEVELIFCKR